MAIQNYSTVAGRINEFKGEIIGHAMTVEALGPFGQMRKMPKNSGDNVTYRSYLPYGATTTNANTINRPSVTASAHLLTEGVTPTADTVAARDISVTLQEYGALYSYSNKTALMYEDDIPSEMVKICGERIGLLREMIRWGALKAGTNTFYAGGTSRATVDETVTWNLLSKVSRNLKANHGKPITSVLAPSMNYSTFGVNPSFVVVAHTDLEHDIYALPDFTKAVEYGQKKMVHDMEIGSVGNFRFVLSPELASIADSGAAVGSTGLYSTSASNIDVYPMIVMAEDAWGDVALRGLDSVKPFHLSYKDRDKSDVFGQRGYIGASFFSATTITNNGWMAVVECGVTSL